MNEMKMNVWMQMVCNIMELVMNCFGLMGRWQETEK